MSNERSKKIEDLIAALMKNEEGRNILISSLHKNGAGLKFHVESMVFPEVTDPERLKNARNGVYMDTETTGVDPFKDKVTQLAMRKFKYDDIGILSLGEIYDELNDPGIPIPEEVSRLTGLTDEDVKGKKIDQAEVRAFIADADKIVCHNSAFDRKVVENNLPEAGFETKVFDCSLTQIDWQRRGENGRSLELLAMRAGYIYGAHNALNDINAMPYVLSQEHPELGTPFSEMVANSQKKQLLIIAEYSPFESKDTLKERGYRWSPDGDDSAGFAKTWWTTIPDEPEALQDEADFLREKVYHRDVVVPAFELSGTERYSARRPTVRRDLRTAEIKSPIDIARQSTFEGTVQAEMGF
jgi:DNA polymerase-3 subunit epsilon